MVVIWCVSIEFTLFDYAATNTDSPQARVAEALTLILRTRLHYNQLGVQPLAPPRVRELMASSATSSVASNVRTTFWAIFKARRAR